MKPESLALRAAIIALLAACASPPAEAPATQAPAADTCGIAQHSSLIGRSASTIDRASLPPRTRIIGPNDAVTMDYSEQRLNIMTDAQGVVTELRCF